MIFLDEARIAVQGGRGGDGCVAFRREKFVPRGGPAGGDGGHGGDVYLVGDESLNTLYHLRYRQTYTAERGRHGEGSNKTGKSGDDLEIAVPLGTVARDAESGVVLGEILDPGERLMVAAGGTGGRGNARFSSSTNRAPRRADPGGEGEERRLELQLKLLADVGLVGLPNAGKSTLISRLSAARPKIADYPFTTLVPQLGVVARGPLDEPFVLADLPGLIAGAAAGAGLGHQFLRHVERCRVLVHLVDLSSHGFEALDGVDAEEPEAREDVRVIEDELVAFDAGLLERPRLLVGSKVDAVDPERRADLEALATEKDLPYFEVSAVTGEGLEPLVAELGQRLEALRRAEAEASDDEAAEADGAEADGAEQDRADDGAPA